MATAQSYDVKPSHAELCAAHDAQDWDYLWRAAIPLVKFAIKRMMRHGEVDPYWARDDLLQEGLLAAGLAVRSWNTLESKFSTWITVNVRGSLLDYVNRHANAGVGSKHQSTTVVSLQESRFGASSVERDDSSLEALAYEEGAGIPLPETVALRQQVREAVQHIHDPIEQDVLMRWFGFNGAPEGTRSIGVSYGRSHKWAQRLVADAIKKVPLRP